KGCYTCNQSASSYRDKDIINSRKLMNDLHGYTSLALRYIQVVERMDECVSMLFGKLVGLVTGIIINISVKNDIRSQILCSVYLDQRRNGRHNDRCLASEHLCRVGNALGMISCGSRDQSFLLFLLGQRTDLII